ncbi:MAG: NADase-type glycan-binding domain-containing protein [Anaerolineae bacterium]
MKRVHARAVAVCVVLVLVSLPLAGCKTITEGPGWWPGRETATPTSPAPVDDPAYATARDAALDHMREVEPVAPPADAEWEVEDATPQDSPGTKVLRYSSGAWVVHVGAPIIAPQYLFRSLYRVVVENPAESVNYECRVTAEGLVYEAPLAAIDALLRVLTYLQQSYPDDAPAEDLAWIEERATPEGIVGATTYHYLAGDWIAEVTYPITAPGSVVYAVGLSNQATGYAWRGEVHPDGSLVELAAQPIANVDLPRVYVNEELNYALRYPVGWMAQEGGEDEPLTMQRDGATLLVRIRRAEAEPILLSRATPTGDVQTSGVVGILGQEVPRSVVVQDGQIRAVMYSVEAEGLAVSFDLFAEPAGSEVPAPAQAEADAIARSLVIVPRPEAGPVEAWKGTVVKLRAGNQYTHYFQRQDGLRAGILATDDALNAQIDEAAWSGAMVEVSGVLELNVPAYAGRQIVVTEISAIGEAAPYARDLTAHATASATSALPNDQWGQYDATSAVDGLPETAWTEDAEGDGIGETLTLTFPKPLIVTRVGVIPGWDHPDGYWGINNRLRRATVSFSGGETVVIDLADATAMQTFAVDPVQTTSVVLTIEEVYPGSRYDDTCVGEVAVWGKATP